MIKLIAALLIATLIDSSAMAHGEEKPGPHGGHIRMPANFHTEVVPDQNGSFHIYLLDIQFQNPIVKNSSITAYIVNGKKKFNLECEVMAESHFHCSSAKSTKTGTLYIKAKRDGVKASMNAEYRLPIKPFESKSQPTSPESQDHSRHH